MGSAEVVPIPTGDSGHRAKQRQHARGVEEEVLESLAVTCGDDGGTFCSVGH
jgi:hypothetical protein